jgi:predicted  nucleic acid-binding Zn-ribbon protein
MLRLKEDLQKAITDLCNQEIEIDNMLDTQSSWLIDFNEYTGEDCSAYASAEEIRDLEWKIYYAKEHSKQLEQQIRRLRAALTVEAVGEEAWNRRKHAIGAWDAHQKLIYGDPTE